MNGPRPCAYNVNCGECGRPAVHYAEGFMMWGDDFPMCPQHAVEWLDSDGRFDLAIVAGVLETEFVLHTALNRVIELHGGDSFMLGPPPDWETR